MRQFSIGLIVLLSSACATAQGQVSEGQWCNGGTQPRDAGWIPLADYVLLSVDNRRLRDAAQMLRNKTIVPLSGEDANRLLPTGRRATSGQLFLIRAGILLPPHTSAEEVNAQAARPDGLEVHWSERYRAVGLASYMMVRGPAIPYDVPLVLVTSVRPVRAYMGCTSAD